MSFRLKSRHVLTGIGFGVLLAFQNCAQPVDEATLDESSFNDNVPFAYDAKIDTLAHMSCSDMAPNFQPRAYFTFRAGAYTSKGGLKLTPEFINATKFYDSSRRANLLRDTTRNSSTRLMLSIRTASNFQSPWALEQVNVGEDTESFLEPLDTAFIAGPLATLSDPLKEDRHHYFPGAETKRLMEASVRFNRGETAIADTRAKLHSKALLLTMGYSNSLDELDTTLRGDTPGSSSSVYGSGFYIKFSAPAKFPGGASGADRVISTETGAIEEVDLRTKKVRVGGTTFICPSSYQFMVVREADRNQTPNRVTCNAWADRYSGADQKARLEAIRRVLRPEDWYVDPANNCIIPRGPGGPAGDSCYGNLGTRTINYGLSSSSCTPSNTVACPHFVSVCVAQ